jgi:phosphonate transport system ATP-binding protein
MDYRLQLAAVSHCYVDGKCAIKDIDLAIAPGEQVALIGPSGAGKTTLLHTLALALEPTRGTLTWGGSDPWKMMTSRARHQLRAASFLAPQQPPLPPRQRVVHAVLAARLTRAGTWPALRSLLATPAEADVREAYTALEAFRLEDKLWLRCDRLSGGERQRVGLARMFVAASPVNLLDEPVSSLDPVLGAASLAAVQADAARRNATMVVSLHDVNLARERFGRLIGLRDGLLQFDLPTSEVTEDRLRELYGEEFGIAVASFGLPDAGASQQSIIVTACG